MKLSLWKDPALRRRLLGALTVLLVIGLAAHPELRLLVPLLDATGLDVLMTLLGLQAVAFFSDSLKPWLLVGWQRIAPALWPVGRRLGRLPGVRRAGTFAGAMLYPGSGSAGLAAWLVLHRAWHAARNAAFPAAPVPGDARAA